MTHTEYMNQFPNDSEAIAWEQRTLSIGREFLPRFALAVLDGAEGSTEYWQWLADSAAEAAQE